MPIVYWRPSDEDAPPQLSAAYIDDQSNWWAGIQQCGAVLALGVALSLGASQAALAQQTANQFQDDPAGSLFSGAEEYYWQNPVPPVPQTFVVPAPWIYDEQTPLLFGQPDEDFWANPVPPVSSYPVPIVFADDQIIVPQPAVALQPDEDFWQNAVPPVPQTFLYPQQWTFDDQVPALSAPPAFQPDEDFWMNPVPPMQTLFCALTIWDSGDAVFVRTKFVPWIQEDDS